MMVLLSKKENHYYTPNLKFAKEQLDNPHCYLENVQWTDEIKVELFGKHYLIV